MASSKIPFRHIREGQGGTFQFRNNGSDIEKLTHIGTFHCLTCVSIYLPIDDERCFFAHINAWLNDTVIALDGRRTERKKMSGVGEKEGVQIEAEVKRMLENECALPTSGNRWSRDDVLRARESGREIVVVCQHLEEGRPGVHVIRGVADFLDGQVDTHNLCKTNADGFVVNHVEPGKVEYISDGDLTKFDAVDEPMPAWQIGVEKV